MDANDIKIEFIRKGLSQTIVARRLGVSTSLVNRVINPKAVSRPVSQGIADILGKDLSEVFTELTECRRCAACN
jgi:transcriptional regulator with XRE-family HTH domain